MQRIKIFVAEVAYWYIVVSGVVRDFATTTFGRLIIRLALSVAFLAGGVYLAMMRNPFDGPTSSGTAFWGSLAAGFGVGYLGLRIPNRTIIRPAIRQFRFRRGLTE